jgi:hypothetical protein
MPINSVPIELGGKTRNLRFSFNALCLLEDTLGLPIAEIGEALSGSVKLGTVRALLYAGLSDEDETLTLKQVGRLIDSSRLGELAEAIRKAFEGAFAPEPGEEKKA